MKSVPCQAHRARKWPAWRAMLGKNGLVKLHAFNVVLAMPQPHDGLLLTVLVLCPGWSPRGTRSVAASTIRL